MIITIGSIKGGVGKSTIATNLATALASRDFDVVLYDADFQKTSSNWFNDRQQHKSPPKLQFVCEFDNLRDNLNDLNKSNNFVIVDCQGRDGIELRTALVYSDILITPFRPSQADIDTLFVLEGIIGDALELNPKLTTLGVVSIAPTGVRSEKEISSAIDVAKSYSTITVLNTILYDRKAYRDALGMGQGVCELTTPRLLAPIEFDQFVSEVLNYGK